MCTVRVPEDVWLVTQHVNQVTYFMDDDWLMAVFFVFFKFIFFCVFIFDNLCVSTHTSFNVLDTSALEFPKTMKLTL